jgi:ADP-ribosylglycohydrolase
VEQYQNHIFSSFRGQMLFTDDSVLTVSLAEAILTGQSYGTPMRVGTSAVIQMLDSEEIY